MKYSALALPSVLAVAATTPPTQCSNNPAGSLHSRQHLACASPLEDDINLEGDSRLWELPPRCFGTVNHTSSDVKVNCVFSSPSFRGGHGLSIITSPQVAADLVSVEALDDRPDPPAAMKRKAGGPAYDVVDVEGKGKGVVALRRIRKGEILMVDFPALLVAMPVLESLKAHHRRRMVRQAINLLPNRTREEVLGLHRTGGYEVDAILGTNTGSVILEDDQVHVALFPKIARLNHDCRPNAHYIFSPSRLTAEVIAYRAIEPGEEVTLSYVPLATKHDIRRSTLKENWGFDCSCAMCRDEPLKIQDSESGRRRIVELKGTAAHAKSEGFFQDAINIVEEWTLFAEEEGVPDPEPELHGTLAELYTLKAGKTGLPEDWAKARRYARMAVNGWLQLGSVDGEALEAARVQLRKLEGR